MASDPLAELRDQYIEERTLWRAGDRWRKPRVRELYERWFAASVAAGKSPDSLERYDSDEESRFFSKTAQGADGHVYWLGGQTFRRNGGKPIKPDRWWWEHLYEKPKERGVLQQICGDKHCIHPHHREFVTWGAFRRQFTDEQLISILKIATMRVGHTPSREEYERTGLRPVGRIFEYRFGSWTKAREAAGLPPHTFKSGYTEQECIDKILEVYEIQGRIPTQDYWDEHHILPSMHTIKRRFGTWPDAMKAAGLEWKYDRRVKEKTNGVKRPLRKQSPEGKPSSRPSTGQQAARRSGRN